MKKYISLLILTGGLFLTSCQDFLQREPLDFGDENVFFNNVQDLKYYANSFYTLFPENKSYMNGGVYREDENSDNQTSFWSNSNFFPGTKQVPKLGDDSQWKFTTIRNCNYFIHLVEERAAAKVITGSEEEINHYLGEIYFFRAYDYYRLLKNYGDVPILTEVLTDDMSLLKISSRRAPRNKVARFIIDDLKHASELMMKTAPELGRLSRDCARLMLARIALFEATWERYHAGSCFVPNGARWPGKNMYPDYEYNADTEIEFFLDKAIEYSELVADARPLYENYKEMFTSVEIDAIPEVILAKSYYGSVNGHGVNRALSLAGKTGYTRSVVESFLMADGLPIYVSENYQTDVTIEKVLANRDNRLIESVNPVKMPRIQSREAEFCPTGYQVGKWLNDSPEQTASQTGGTTSNPIFRSAEAYCIYLEAYYERHHNLEGKCDAYWKALRTRAKVDTNYMKTINATNLSKERDLAAKVLVEKGMNDATLYNIRRERRCEFIGEGMRLDDLKRWRALDAMRNYEVMGINLWAEMYKRYEEAKIDLKPSIVSPYEEGIPESTYIRVFKINESDLAYNGYNFPKQHYLEPIPLSEILLTADNSEDLQNSNIYQNPGWPVSSGTIADYSFNCDPD